MMSDFIFRSAAAFGGTPFRLKKCTALGSAGAGAGAGAAVGGVPVLSLVVLLVLLVHCLEVYLVNLILIRLMR